MQSMKSNILNKRVQNNVHNLICKQIGTSYTLQFELDVDQSTVKHFWEQQSNFVNKSMSFICKPPVDVNLILLISILLHFYAQFYGQTVGRNKCVNLQVCLNRKCLAEAGVLGDSEFIYRNMTRYTGPLASPLVRANNLLGEYINLQKYMENKRCHLVASGENKY